MTDAKSKTTAYAYDNLDRLVTKTYPDSTSVSYTYDLDSRLTQVTDATGTYSFSYDHVGRLTGTTTNYSFLTGRTLTESYAYDAASNRTSFTDPEGGVTNYTYDTLNRLTNLKDFSNGSSTFSYDALGRRTSLARPNGVSTSYSYDNLSRLLQVLHQSGSSLVESAAYTYDAPGNRASRTESTPGKRGTVTRTANYTYDAIYELTQAATTDSYTYDAVGNRLTDQFGGTYTYNNSNELTAYPAYSWTYDNNGNTTSETVSTSTTSYNWDFENRLTSVALPGTGGTVTFKYDPFGRRIYKSSSSGTTIYAYDGDNVSEQLNSSGTATARYTQGLGIDEPLEVYEGNASYYYHADGLGSITELTKKNATTVNTYYYDTFGDDSPASSETVSNPFHFTARERDSEIKLDYYRARYYDPLFGRFLSEDPVRLGDGGPSLYRYVRNNPANLVDPSGAQEATAAGAAVGCVAGPAGCAVGAAIGAVVDVITDVAIVAGGAYLVMSAADAYDSVRDYAKDKADRSRPKCSHCLPCEPPVGTIGYQADTDRGSAPHRGVAPPHWKLFVMLQNPNNCRCFWSRIPDNRGGFGGGTPPPFAVPIGPAAGGGFAP